MKSNSATTAQPQPCCCDREQVGYGDPSGMAPSPVLGTAQLNMAQVACHARGELVQRGTAAGLISAKRAAAAAAH